MGSRQGGNLTWLTFRPWPCSAAHLHLVMRWQIETHAEAAAAKRYESLTTDELLLAELYNL
jgi:hypothetical protein